MHNQIYARAQISEIHNARVCILYTRCNNPPQNIQKENGADFSIASMQFFTLGSTTRMHGLQREWVSSKEACLCWLQANDHLTSKAAQN